MELVLSNTDRDEPYGSTGVEIQLHDQSDNTEHLVQKHDRSDTKFTVYNEAEDAQSRKNYSIPNLISR